MKKHMCTIYILIILASIFLLTSLNNNIEASSFKFKRKSINVYDNFDLKTIITDTNAIINYSSSNNSIVSVNSNGIITGNSMGQATITATDTSGNTINCLISVGYYVGIDISFANNTVDWNKIKNEGIDFVMFRSSYGWYDNYDAAAGKPYNFQYDAQLYNNIRGASDYGIPFGIYHYSYARNTTEASWEAEYTINALKSTGTYANNISLPIAYDVEDNKYQGSISKSELTDIVITYCTKIREAGYAPMVYASKSWFMEHLDINRLNNLGYDFWYALWHHAPGNLPIQIGNSGIYPLIWQHTSQGSIDGANTGSGTVDMNIMYMKERVKIDFVNEVDENVTTRIIDKGGSLSNLPNIEKDGYYFKGWKDKNGTEISTSTKFSNNVTLSPIFEKIIPIEAINLNLSSSYLLKDNVLNLSVTYSPENTNVNKSIIWTSNNEEIAKVNDGKITGISRGNATITAKSKYNEDIISTIEVIVYEDIKGDVDNNGYVNIFDAYFFLKQLSKESIELPILNMKNADIDLNGQVNIFDVYALLKQLAK